MRLLALVTSFALCPVSLYAQSLEDKIGSALRATKPLTRSLAATPDSKAVAEEQVIDRLRTRSISVEPAQAPTAEERAQIAEIARDKPAIDLEILFEYNSADISPKAVPALIALGNALSRQDLKGSVFLINGHTDAAGGRGLQSGAVAAPRQFGAPRSDPAIQACARYPDRHRFRQGAAQGPGQPAWRGQPSCADCQHHPAGDGGTVIA